MSVLIKQRKSRYHVTILMLGLSRVPMATRLISEGFTTLPQRPFCYYFINKRDNMKNQLTLSAISAILSGLMPMPAGMTRDGLTSMAPFSRGKSGAQSGKRSNAAAFKRAAKKRNNIRKH